LDVDHGKVVKGVNFVDLVDAGDPVELSRFYDESGADELVYLDITASSEDRDILLEVVERTAEQVFIPLTVGGGIRSKEDARILLRKGADKVSVNTAAVNNPALISDIACEFGNQCVVVAIDAKENPEMRSGYEVYVNGGRTPTAKDAIDWAESCERLNAGELLVTSMDRDGTKSGYDLNLLAAIRNRVKLPLIASGGVGDLDDFVKGATAGADGLLAASVFHFGEFTIEQVKQTLINNSFKVRS
jgi:cyclase